MKPWFFNGAEVHVLFEGRECLAVESSLNNGVMNEHFSQDKIKE
jgi:hypothetical protein